MHALNKLAPTLFSGFIISLLIPKVVFAAPTIGSIQTNQSAYLNSQIPKYEKFEVTFNVNTSAQNPYFPFVPPNPTPPPGIDPTNPSYQGVTIDAVFTDPNGIEYNQPAFYYQAFNYQAISNDDWIYPTNTYSWKVRFTPNQTGTWQFRLTATDATGTINSPNLPFQVTGSNNKGFIKASPNDPRYFEYDDGTYFPALGFNLNGGSLDNRNPVLGNTEEFTTMGNNGIQLTRIWPTQFSIYGEAWAPWRSNNIYHSIVQEPRIGVINPKNSQLSSNYPNLIAPTPPIGSENYLWLEYNTTVFSDGMQQRFTPCRYTSDIPIKRNTQYRVTVRYQTADLEGPKVAGLPFGFAVKTSSEWWGNQPARCNDPDAGNRIAATYNPTQVSPDPQNPGWMILQGTFTSSSTSDFIRNFYVTFDNVASQDSDNKAGHVFIDQVWLEEASCNSNCANLINKPRMSMLLYINQRAAYAFDRVVELAKDNNLYLKPVMLEKNDRIFQTIGFDGNPTAEPSVVNFYGNRRTVTKVRWLQQAWWRYMQARWGYSPNIHSWELLNEGHSGNSEGHWDLADEFGKYMKCRVFGVAVSSANPYEKCAYDHPNAHMVTTSFFSNAYPWQFWNNQSSGVNLTFAEMDYADQHYYANVDDVSPLAGYYDSAQFSYALSTAANNWAPGKRKPFMRGESGWNAPASTYLESNADGGEWLHDYIWAGINSGGLMEHFFAGGHFASQIWKTGSHDHRPMFKTYYDFIKDIPLNNGNYQEASASASSADIRVWGQKDTVNSRAHLWIANKKHTWYNSMGGYTGGPPAEAIPSLSGSITIEGFNPNTQHKVEWWNTYTGQATSTQNLTSNQSGQIVLNVSNLASDTAVRIGDYSVSPTPTSLPGDINLDGTVNIQDYILLSNAFGTNNSSADLNGDGTVNIQDYIILSNNFGETS